MLPVSLYYVPGIIYACLYVLDNVLFFYSDFICIIKIKIT